MPGESADRPTHRTDTDIEVSPPEGRYALSRGDPKRKIVRVDRYDRRAEVMAYETLTSTGTVRITLRVVDDHPLTYNPGQFIGIRLNVPGMGWRKTPYCLLSPPNDEKTFQLLVRLVPDGPLSIYLASLEPGDSIAFRGPTGRSMMPKQEYDELVLMATGVGVGPFVFFLKRLAAEGSEVPVRLFWGLRLAEDICLLDELDELARANPWFTYHVTLSSPPPGWTGMRGRITESVPALIPTLANKRFYLVGNGAMIEEISTVLSDLGVDRSFIYEEAFFNGKFKADPAVLAEIRDRFVAADLFSPYRDQEHGLLHLEKPIAVRRQEAARRPSR
ncbi:MAG TPA: FAD-dependent oxidoreductase [Acidimicrobiales bacterium]|nr:FAD-dependent oxidoreductase [Acidimicrobiales bacterium]